MSHAPVMCDQAVSALAPHADGFYIDATFGAGGYSRALLAAGAGHVLGLDRDPHAAEFAQSLTSESGGAFSFEQCRFSEMEQAAGKAGREIVDGVVMDICLLYTSDAADE